MHRITLELDDEQLSILMGCLESRLEGVETGERRTTTTLAVAVESAARTWRPGANTGLEYEAVRIAPVYRQLLAHCGKDQYVGSVWDTEDPEEFARYLAEARAATAQPLAPSVSEGVADV